MLSEGTVCRFFKNEDWSVLKSEGHRGGSKIATSEGQECIVTIEKAFHGKYACSLRA